MALSGEFSSVEVKRKFWSRKKCIQRREFTILQIYHMENIHMSYHQINNKQFTDSCQLVDLAIDTTKYK
jgi:hypothetical protein